MLYTKAPRERRDMNMKNDTQFHGDVDDMIFGDVGTVSSDR